MSGIYSGFKTSEHEARQRLDLVLAQRYLHISRSYLQKLCADEKVLVNDQAEKSGYKLRLGDRVDIKEDLDSIGKPASIDLPILYEDDDILVINKPAGVLSHALSKFHREPSVASFLRQHLTRDGVPDDMRFGIVHRLDRQTSGIMICAKTKQAVSFLQEQFAKRTVRKQYVAIVSGVPSPAEALIDLPIERNPKSPATFRVGGNGKPAQTIYKLKSHSNQHALLELSPKTGRTHQLRVHMAHIGCPILGDVLYGGELADRLYLHAFSLRLQLSNGKTKTFEAPLPQDFQSKLNNSGQQQ